MTWFRRRLRWFVALAAVAVGAAIVLDVRAGGPDPVGISLRVPSGWMAVGDSKQPGNPLLRGPGFVNVMIGPPGPEITEGWPSIANWWTQSPITLHLDGTNVRASVVRSTLGGPDALPASTHVTVSFLQRLDGGEHRIDVSCSTTGPSPRPCADLLGSWRWEDSRVSAVQSGGVHSGRIYLWG